MDIQIGSEDWGQKHAKFDWWQASIELQRSKIWLDSEHRMMTDVEAFKAECSARWPTADWITTNGVQGYGYRETLKVGGTTLVVLLHGGIHDTANITASGSTTEEVRDFIRDIYPEGRASRLDSAVDSLSGTGGFRATTQWLEGRAKKAGINTTWITNSDPTKGDTLYIGSKQSRVQIRVYEKGKQMQYKAGDWWRAEVQVRPRSKDKAYDYSLSAGSVWSVSTITRDLWHYLLGERLSCMDTGYKHKDKDLDDRLAHLAIQYGNLLAEALSVHGDADSVIARLDWLLSTTGKPSISDRVSPVPHCPF